MNGMIFFDQAIMSNQGLWVELLMRKNGFNQANVSNQGVAHVCVLIN